jgi:hypothetical protein
LNYVCYIYIYEQYNPETARRNTPKLKHSISIEKNETPIETELTTLLITAVSMGGNAVFFLKKIILFKINIFLFKLF